MFTPSSFKTRLAASSATRASVADALCFLPPLEPRYLVGLVGRYTPTVGCPTFALAIGIWLSLGDGRLAARLSVRVRSGLHISDHRLRECRSHSLVAATTRQSARRADRAMA